MDAEVDAVLRLRPTLLTVAAAGFRGKREAQGAVA